MRLQKIAYLPIWVALIFNVAYIPSVGAADFLTGGWDLTNAQDGVTQAIFMKVIGEDALKCWTYGLSIFWNSVDSIKYLVAYFGEVENPSNIYLAVESLGLVIHKSPIVFEECVRIIPDIASFDQTVSQLGDVRNLHLWTHLLENLFYNFADMMENEEVGRKVLSNWQYREEFGHCQRYDEVAGKKIQPDGTGDYKITEMKEKECKAHCSEDPYCVGIDYDNGQCKHWVGDIIGDGVSPGFTCQIKYKDYMKFGESVGMIMADILFNSPIDEIVWTPELSKIVSEDRDNRSTKVPSSLYLKVQDSKPMTIFDKFADIAYSKMESVKTNQNKVRSEQQIKLRDEFINSGSILKNTDPKKTFQERFRDGRKARKDAQKMKSPYGALLKEAQDKEKEAIDELMDILQIS